MENRTPKFKKGDRVVLVGRGYPITKIGWVGTMIERPEVWDESQVPQCRVLVKWDSRFLPRDIESELAVDDFDIVHLSKLYKVLE